MVIARVIAVAHPRQTAHPAAVELVLFDLALDFSVAPGIDPGQVAESVSGERDRVF
jgi:hypothetical protein